MPKPKSKPVSVKAKAKAKLREEIWRERSGQWAREEHARALAVIAEFGGRKLEGRLLVPEDDPGNDMVKLALAGEVLRLRYQMRLLHSATEFALAGRPFGIIPPGPGTE